MENKIVRSTDEIIVCVSLVHENSHYMHDMLTDERYLVLVPKDYPIWREQLVNILGTALLEEDFSLKERKRIMRKELRRLYAQKVCLRNYVKCVYVDKANIEAA